MKRWPPLRTTVPGGQRIRSIGLVKLHDRGEGYVLAETARPSTHFSDSDAPSTADDAMATAGPSTRIPSSPKLGTSLRATFALTGGAL